MAQARYLAIGFTDWMLDVVRRPLAVAWDRHCVDEGPCSAAPPDALGRVPIVVVEECASAMTVVAVGEAAHALAIRPGVSLAEAESICPDDAIDGRMRAFLRSLRDGADVRWRGRLLSIEGRVVALRADPRRGRWMLTRLAECLARWIPSVMPDGDGHDAIGCTGLVGDLTGCGPLFRRMHGTEQELMRRVHASLARRGFRCRLATASTIGAAVALVRSGWNPVCRRAGASPCRAIPAGREGDALDPLPVGALRIAPEAIEALRSVEVVTIGQLSRLGRQGVAARWSGRFGDDPRSGATDGSGSVRTAAVGSTSPRRGRRTSRNVAAPGLFDADAQFDQGFARTTARARSHGRDDRVGHGEAGGAASAGRRVSADLGAGFRVDEFQGVLRRLDQALGLVPEQIEPLRPREPLAIVRDFDSPVVRMEHLIRAMGVLVVGMSEALHARREGLRHAVITFEHARFPADTELIGAPRSDRTQVELRPGRATARRMHLWSLVQPKLETVSLAYGIERIEWRVLDTARLRFRQLGMPVGRGGVVATDTVSRASRDSLRGGRQPKTSTDLKSGIGSSHVAETGHSSSDPALEEWIDIVRARFGESGVTHPCRPARPWSIEARPWSIEARPWSNEARPCINASHASHASAALRNVLPSDRHRAVAPWPCRPTMFFDTPESATIGVVAIAGDHLLHACTSDVEHADREGCGRCCRGFAAAMASRLPWRDAGMSRNRSGVVCALCESSGIALRWRAGRQRIVAIEDWERIAGPWWTDAGASEISERLRCASEIARRAGVEAHVEARVDARVDTHVDTHVDAVVDTSQRSPAIPEGRLLSRACTEEGLWLLVRWPMRFGSCASEDSPPALSSVSASASYPDDASAETSGDDIGASMHARCSASSRRPSPKGWMRACMHALARGVEVEVLGVWA